MLPTDGQYYFRRLAAKVSYPVQVLSKTSPRKVLFGLNLFLIVCALTIVLYCVSVTWLLFEDDFIRGWIYWLVLSITCMLIVAVAIIGMRGAHMISLDLLLSHFWGLGVMIVPFMLGLFAVFNISFYSRIYLKHQWEDPDFLQIRKIFCNPSRTADNKCIAPLVDGTIFRSLGNDTFESTSDWCLENYNATDCEDIRDAAIDDAVDWGTSFIIADMVIGLIGLILMGMCIYYCVEIVSVQILTQSMLDVINWLLLLPIGSSILQAIGFWHIQDYSLQYTWLPNVYVASAVAQVVALPLGIVSGRLKSRKLLNTYITLVILIICSYALSGALGWFLAKQVVDGWKPSSREVNEIACRSRLPGCTGCDLDPAECPEWDEGEVTTLLSLDFRLTGMVSCCSILYFIGALIVAFLVENSLKNYQSDFV